MGVFSWAVATALNSLQSYAYNINHFIVLYRDDDMNEVNVSTGVSTNYLAVFLW